MKVFVGLTHDCPTEEHIYVYNYEKLLDHLAFKEDDFEEWASDEFEIWSVTEVLPPTQTMPYED